ncbi:MAG: hypothetical protein ACKVP0_08400 [Pirellulaceae bacterium]
MTETATANSPPRAKSGRLLLTLGILSAILGPVIYAVEFQNRVLSSPWYVPALATLAVVFMAASLAQSRTVWRYAVTGFTTLFAGLVWLMFLIGMAAPPYTGSVEVGRAFPKFETTLAGGKGFSQADLTGDQNTILLFFRGRW